VTWAEVEEAVALAITVESPLLLSEAIALTLARAAIKSMQELRLTAVVPDGG
jgi:hypothetical protein